MLTSFILTPVTLVSPRTSSTTLFHITFIFGLLLTLSCIILLALKESLLCIIVTLLTNFVRNRESSIAVSPPPTMATSFFLKKGASHVAQLLIPLPMNCFSEGIPSHFADAPVAIITLLARYSCDGVLTLKGLCEKSTLSTFSPTNLAPNFSACFRIRSIISEP